MFLLAGSHSCDCSECGLQGWHCVNSSANTKISEQHGASIFRL